MSTTPSQPHATLESVEVAQLEQIVPGQRLFVRSAGKELVLFNVDGQLYAVDDACPHAGASLSAGKLEGTLLRCPAHGLRFDLRDGCMAGAAGMRLASYPVWVSDNRVLVDLRATPASAASCRHP